MKRLRFWLFSAAFTFPGILLLTSGLVQLQDGSAIEAAFPIPYALSLNRSLPKMAYNDAAKALRGADPEDGRAQIWSAEARFKAGAESPRVLPQVENGLLQAPASAEGWAFYSAMLERADPQRAALALSQAMVLAPNDFFWTGNKVILASHLWNYLNSDTKSAALSEARSLWGEPALRVDILRVLASSDGTNLVTRAFADEPDKIRAINRYMLTIQHRSKTARP